MGGYSLRNSEDPNELVIYCHQCRKEIKADKRMGKNLTPTEGMCWPEDQGPPTKDSLLWSVLIDNHQPLCQQYKGIKL